MIVDRVPLRFSAVPFAYMRELTGMDEQEAGGSSTLHAIALIDHVCVPLGDGALVPGGAVDLCAHDRDRILAAIYRRTYGPKLSGVADCKRCAAPFDFEFALDDLRAMLDAESDPTPPLGALRLPTGRDELAVAELSDKEAQCELARRCASDRPDLADATALQAALEKIAPLLDLELSARCPECRAVQMIHFDLQSVLLDELARDRQMLSTEIHLLASTYRWSYHEIMALPRSQRRTFAELVTSDAERRG